EWRGLALFGVGGTTIRLQDSQENRETFGSQRGRHGDFSGYPLMRVTTLMALRSHLLARVNFGAFSLGEQTLAKDLFEHVPENSLTVVDRGFAYASTLTSIEQMGGNRHWLTRARKTHQWTVVEKLGKGDCLVEMELSRQARAEN